LIETRSTPTFASASTNSDAEAGDTMPAMPTRLLADLAFTRAGDKGDISDVTVFAPDRDVYDVLVEQVTPEKVRVCYGDLVRGDVTRYEVPHVLALKFVLQHALGGGGPSSLRADNLGKAMGGPLLRMPIEIPAALDARLGARPAPPRDPYEGQQWVVD
jgi:hypothetical protein